MKKKISWSPDDDQSVLLPFLLMEMFHFLSWGKNGTWVSDEELTDSVLNLEFATSIPESSCNTRKEKDKRSRRHTVGLHIVAWPCGIIPDFSELFGSESIDKKFNSHFLSTIF